MSKNPYEIRLETLKMAKEMLDQQWQMGERLMGEMVEQAKETQDNVVETFEKYVPKMYQPDEVIKKANEFYDFITKKQFTIQLNYDIIKV